MSSEQAAPVAPVAPARRDSGASAVQRVLGHPRAAFAALLLGTLIVTAITASVAVRVGGWALDETIMKQSALHYRHGLPGSLLHDANARATSRLFSLLLMPVFALWDGDVAVRTARGICAVLFCSTSIPVYLLARRVLRSPWFAAAAGLLAICGPWLTLGTTMYTETLALPFFMWTVLLMVRAVDKPHLRSELLVLGGIFLCTVTRVQLFALFFAWILAVWVVSRGRSDSTRGWAHGAWRMAPVTHALLGLGVLLALFRGATGHLHSDAQRLFGPYSELQDRKTVSADTLLAVAHEVQALALPAFLAAVAALAWYAGALRAPRTSTRWALAVVALCVTSCLWLISAYVQGGFIGVLTEERYFFYVFPLIWIAAFAAIEDPALAGPRLWGPGVTLIALFATLGLPRPLEPEAAFLEPAGSVVRNIFERFIGSLALVGLSVRDVIALLALVMLVVGAWIWRRFPGGRLVAFVVVPALLQLSITTYAFAAREGHVKGVQGQTGGVLALNAWVDHHSGGNDVTWLNNAPYGIVPSAEGWQYATVFWNSRIRQWATDEKSGLQQPVPTLAALPFRLIDFDDATGLVKGLERAGPFVSYIDSPSFQIAGQSIANGPDNRLDLIAPTEPVTALWLARPLFADGSIDPKRPPALDAWLPPGSNARGLRVMIELVGPTAPVDLHIRLGKELKQIHLDANEVKRFVFEQCVPKRHLNGSIDVDSPGNNVNGVPVGGRISIVRTRPLAGGSCT